MILEREKKVELKDEEYGSSHNGISKAGHNSADSEQAQGYSPPNGKFPLNFYFLIFLK